MGCGRAFIFTLNNFSLRSNPKIPLTAASSLIRDKLSLKNSIGVPLVPELNLLILRQLSIFLPRNNLNSAVFKKSLVITGKDLRVATGVSILSACRCRDQYSVFRLVKSRIFLKAFKKDVVDHTRTASGSC